MVSIRQFLAILLFACACTATAQDFPTHSVRIYVPAAPGGGLDIFARALANDLGKRWGQAVVVENKAGSGGLLAASATLQGPPDGYTLFAITDTVLVANRFSYRKLPYDPDKSFTPLSLMAQGDQLIVVSQATPVRSMKELVKYAKDHPNKLSYGQWGSGSSPQLLFETLNKTEGTGILGVPYKGVAPVMQALMGDEVQLTVMSAMTGAPLLQSGKVRPIASASNDRSPAYPDVPTTAELGLPQLRAYIWFGMVGPAGMPKVVSDKLEHDIRLVLQDPSFLERYPTLRGWTVIASDGHGLTETVLQQTPIIGAMMKAANVEPQ
jgi:tripartite-type tricarboxylate transporter receptor subunit TctC